MGYPHETVEIIPANDVVTYGVILRGDNLVVRGLTIRDFPRICIQLYKPVLKNLVLADLKVSNSSQGISSPHDQVDGALIYNLEITGIDLIGLDCGTDRATNWHVEKTTISMNRGGDGSS